MNSSFSSGQRLAPSGNPKRQAVDALRGYAYQLYVSALAWVRLTEKERLYLEVAEDYALVAQDSLEGVQVKDTAGSGAVTINNQDVLDTLDNFVDLVERNPQFNVSMRFLSTAPIGMEKQTTHRVDGRAVLAYWPEAARNADVKPLRDAILKAAITPRVRTFIDSRNDEELRRDLLKPICWDCGQPILLEVKDELSSALTWYANNSLRLPPSDSAYLPAEVMDHLLETVLKPNPQDRYLDAVTLLRLCEAVGTVTLSRSNHDALMEQAMRGSHANRLPMNRMPRLLENEESIPMPTLLLPRPAALQKAVAGLSEKSVVFLCAGTGMGKTVIARMAARAHGGDWKVVDLRNVSIEECEFRLKQARDEVAAVSVAGVILDDMNEIDSPKVAAALGLLTHSLGRQNAICIITCYRHPSAGALNKLGLDSSASIQIPPLDQAEVASLIHMSGGDPAVWTLYVHNAGGGGHPQLVRAVLAGLQSRGWPTSEVMSFGSNSIGIDVATERDSVRRTLVEVLSDGQRKLLYRASLAAGRFERNMVLHLGEISPQIASTGESLDVLVGPWIDNVGSGQLRISPLVVNVGEEVLPNAEQIAVHKVFADSLLQNGSLDIRRANKLFIHSLKAKSSKRLEAVAHAVITAAQEDLSTLAEWLPGVRFAPLERRIFSDDHKSSNLLRLCQFLLSASSAPQPDHPRKVWEVLNSEVRESDTAKTEAFKVTILAKTLSLFKLPAILPDWFILLRQLRSAISQNAQLSLAFSEMSHSGVMFVTQAIHVGSVGAQLDLIKELDALDPVEREDYLQFAMQTRSGLTAMISGPWLEEVRTGVLNAPNALAAFQEMARITRAWGYLPLTISLEITSSIMLDEYMSDAHGALEVLKKAESEFGSNFDLTRARAKVYFRKHQHRNMISTIQDLEAHMDVLEPLERMLLRREMAISLSELGDWAAAAEQFAHARADVLLTRHDDGQALSLGLLADQALALYQAQDFFSAVTLYEAVLEALPSVDAIETLQAEYCSRVIRHGLLWLHLQAIGSTSDIGFTEQDTVMNAGMCSNMNPPESIRELPKAPAEMTWYMFAPVECTVLATSETLNRLDKRVENRTAPIYELSARSNCLNIAIQTLCWDGFASQLNKLMAVRDYVEKHPEQRDSSRIISPVYDVVPEASNEALSSDAYLGFQKDVLIAFGIVAAASNRLDVLELLRVDFESHPASNHLLAVVKAMTAPEKSAGVANEILHCIHQVATKPELTTDELFRASTRFVVAVSNSDVRKAYEDVLVGWAREAWREKAKSMLGFKNADAVIPKIMEALETPGIAGIAELVLSAEAGVHIELHPLLRQFMHRIVDTTS
jgi:tetratricopeptide (TPR) repeat protein